MDTKIYQEVELVEAAHQIAEGQLVAFPTETVYGLGANALLEDSVRQVFEVKGRPSDNPLIVHVADFSQVEEYVDNFHPLTKKIVANFWPGPLTLIFFIKKASLPLVVTGGLSTAAFRMPDNKKTLEFIKLAGVPIVGPSANTSGKPSPTTAQHVYHDLKGKIAGILDDGATEIGVESTVLDISDPTKPPMILRPGAITKEALEAVLKTTVEVDRHLVEENEVPKSPGMKYKHYSPDTKVLMVRPDDWQAALKVSREKGLKIGILASPSVVSSWGNQAEASFSYQENTIEAATRGLFAGLRALDEGTDLDVILAEAFPEEGLGIAYMNRLKKAAAQNFFEK
ncbi:threonylcarbamoyl-AMP synthase [Enterococcus sp. JM4C]|uniref:L-threonylcarbamoyladenylate synthase n=1 Tax=Candidatus Enterococcus huntleyi TaxID=1857217 RepID=UPI00137A2F0A|nr:L-threonylcarbamoyladenylate synthase [Enterococcus sp. JM4C]KAF1299317.1 threonylcarbamoyl-AMP synthase [Enterococcus sp. JM4C]